MEKRGERMMTRRLRTETHFEIFNIRDMHTIHNVRVQPKRPHLRPLLSFIHSLSRSTCEYPLKVPKELPINHPKLQPLKVYYHLRDA